jgi:hypothetical protein
MPNGDWEYIPDEDSGRWFRAADGATAQIFYHDGNWAMEIHAVFRDTGDDMPPTEEAAKYLPTGISQLAVDENGPCGFYRAKLAGQQSIVAEVLSRLPED